jgi:hypothetical protein
MLCHKALILKIALGVHLTIVAQHLVIVILSLRELVEFLQENIPTT